MPLIEVTLVEGRAPEQLRAAITALTEAAVAHLDAPRDTVRVVLREVPATHWAAGDTTIAERHAARSAHPPAEGSAGTPTESPADSRTERPDERTTP